jgi:TonB-dependent SusC/RagA subfamily outer membrane receptor
MKYMFFYPNESGTTHGVVTDFDGHYSLSVASNVTLRFSYIGYLPQTVAVGGKTRIDVILEEDVKALEEVVVIGYGVQRREAVTGSVASIGGESMRAVQSTNFTQALQGRIAGVEMTQTSTKPGAGMQIRIRGTRSLNASNDPLIVFDGIPFAGTVNDIDPASIKSIDVLKDASATAIYGSRGANGVIMITTNRGVAGQAAQVTYNAYYGVKNALKYPLMDGPQFVQLRKDATETIDELKNNSAKWTNTADQSNDVNADWQDLGGDLQGLDKRDAERCKRSMDERFQDFRLVQHFYDRSAVSVRDFPADHFQYHNLGYGEGEKTINQGDQNYYVSGLISYMGRVMYDYDNRYMLSLAMRSDASSRLAKGHKWHAYPAVSVGWNLHRENFMEGVDRINTLKLRVGYGETSNQSIDPYKTFGELNTRFYNFGDSESGYKTGYYVSELPNQNLGWEYTETWNFGVDFSAFNRRLSGSIEYYRQHTWG